MIGQADRQLVLLHGRELVRDRRYFWFALLFPYGMLGIFLFIGSVVPTGPSGPDFTELVIPLALFLAVTSAALTVTAGPVAALRSKGTLRLLGTTPIGRGRFLATHMAVRLVMVTAQTVLLLAIAVAAGALPLSTTPAMFAVSLLGVALFGSIGYLIGGRMNSPDAATNVSTFVQLGTLFFSGLAFPLFLMPPAVATALSVLPSTFYADLMVAQLPSGRPFHPAWLSIVVVLVAATAIGALAVRTFRWDQGDV